MTPVTAFLLDEMVQVLVQEVGPERIVLFGSQARGEAGADSDVDLLVEEREEFGPQRSRWEELRRIRRVLADFPMAKDVLLFSSGEVAYWQGSINHVIACALREGRVLYQSDHAGAGRGETMGEGNQARSLLTMARKDRRALLALRDPDVGDREIFGFHVQQATEKALKAWLCHLGTLYPKKHDLGALFELLTRAGAVFPETFLPLLAYSDYAVTYRYDTDATVLEEIDRDTAITLVDGLLGLVAGMVDGVDSPA